MSPDAFITRNFQCSDPGLQRFAQVNHYIVRDASSFILKSAKGSAHQANRKIDHRYWRGRNRNGSEDLRLAALAPRLKAAMQQMDQLTGGKLAALTQQARAHHLQEIETVMAEDWARQLYQRCVTDPSAQLPEQAGATPTGTIIYIRDKRPAGAPPVPQAGNELPTEGGRSKARAASAGSGRNSLA